MSHARNSKPELRHDWSVDEVERLIARPFMDLLFEAQAVHRGHFDPHTIQVSTLLNIKTGGCAENCGYCSQSAHHDTELEREQLLDVDAVLADARKAKEAGIGRFCMGAAWRKPNDKDLDKVIAMIQGVKALGMESCVTLGMLTGEQALRLKEAGLDYYNHNLDTSREYYPQVVTTRSYDDRLDTLAHARKAGLSVCAGGILGLGETRRDRAAMLVELANLPSHPQSVPLNKLVKVPGTPMADLPDLDDLEFIRTVAAARIMMPASHVRLSAGREAMSDEAQALCFFAGANSLFYGDRLLTTDNATTDRDRDLFQRLDLHALAV
ncbi:MAG: biotin synthase BioB [Gammaproteobacteria bacterium]|nr:biotin synthase BioB [Gammaproteobacteria bacterium]